MITNWINHVTAWSLSISYRGLLGWAVAIALSGWDTCWRNRGISIFNLSFSILFQFSILSLLGEMKRLPVFIFHTPHFFSIIPLTSKYKKHIVFIKRKWSLMEDDVYIFWKLDLGHPTDESKLHWWHHFPPGTISMFRIIFLPFALMTWKMLHFYWKRNSKGPFVCMGIAR